MKKIQLCNVYWITCWCMQTVVHVTGFEEETLNNFKGSYIIAIIFAVNTRIVGEVGLHY